MRNLLHEFELLNSSYTLYKAVYIAKATTALRVANITGTLIVLDTLINLCRNIFTIGVNFSGCVSKAITNKYIRILRMFLEHTLTQVGFDKGLGPIYAVIDSWTVRVGAKTIFHVSQDIERKMQHCFDGLWINASASLSIGGTSRAHRTLNI